MENRPTDRPQPVSQPQAPGEPPSPSQPQATVVPKASEQSHSPDAVIFPAHMPLKATRAFLRLHEILDLADATLGVDKVRGEKSYMRPLPSGQGYFVTTSPDDTLLFPIGHDLEKQSRYNWVDQPNGFRLGYLVPDAKETPRA
jgi:hypothetical protein